MRAVIFVTFAFLVGCASSIERARELRAGAPDWYAARKVEISGSGYPHVRDIPLVTNANRPGRTLDTSRIETLGALDAFLADPRSAPAEETPEQILQWASHTRRAVEGQIPAPDFLTDEDVAALHAIFDTPRGRL